MTEKNFCTDCIGFADEQIYEERNTESQKKVNDKWLKASVVMKD